MTDDLNDDLSDLLDAASTGPARAPIYRAPDKFVPAVERFAEGCPKCRGTGTFTSYSGRALGPCFACKGKGSHTFKTSPEARAKARIKSADRATAVRVEKAQERNAFREANKTELAWLDRAAERQHENAHKGRNVWAFPIELTEKLSQYGTLTEGQLGAIRKCMARDAERTAQRATEAPAADTAGIDRLKAAFDKAAAYAEAKGLSMRSPKITIGGMTIKPAKATSTNPGALYVNVGEAYLGKIAGGRFIATRDCTPEQSKQVLAFVADPKQAAEAYGQTTGTCCICNATLRSEWKHRGIGPICAEKFGW